MAWTLVFTLHYLVTSWLKGIVIVPYRLSSPQKLRPCIPIKKTKIKKQIASARGTMERGKDSEHSKSLKSSPGSAINREPQILPDIYMAEACVVSFPFPSWPARFLFSLSPASLRHKEASVELGESCIELCLPRRMLQVMYRSDSGVEQVNRSQYSWHSKYAHKMQWLQSKTACNQREKERKTVFVFSILNWGDFSIERFHSRGQHL